MNDTAINFWTFSKIGHVLKTSIHALFVYAKVSKLHVYSQIYQDAKLTIDFWSFSKIGHVLETSTHGLFVHTKSK